VAIAFVQSASNTATSNMTTTGVTPTFSGAATAGNLVVVMMASRGNRAFTASDEFSWSNIPNSNLNNSTNCDITGYYRIAGAGEAASQGNFTIDSANVHCAVIAMEFSGVDSVTPFADSNSQTDSGTAHDAVLGGSLDSGTTYALAWFWVAAQTTDYASVSAGTLQETPNTSGGSPIAAAGAYQLTQTGATSYSRTTTAGGSAASTGFWVVMNTSTGISTRTATPVTLAIQETSARTATPATVAIQEVVARTATPVTLAAQATQAATASPVTACIAYYDHIPGTYTTNTAVGNLLDITSETLVYYWDVTNLATFVLPPLAQMTIQEWAEEIDEVANLGIADVVKLQMDEAGTVIAVFDSSISDKPFRVSRLNIEGAVDMSAYYFYLDGTDQP
jgi:hypothetical protein